MYKYSALWKIAFFFISLACISLSHAKESGRDAAGEAPRESTALKTILSLKDCLSLAVENHPELQVRSHELSMAEADMKIARGAFLPAIYFRGSYTRINEQVSLPVFPSTNLFTTLGTKNSSLIGTTTIQPIYDGRLFSLKKAATRQREVAALQKEVVQKQVVATVKKSYYKTLFFKELQRLQASFRGPLAKQRKELKEQYERGDAAELDITRAEGAMAKTGIGYQDAKAEYGDSKDELKRLIGYPLNKKIVLKGRLEDFIKSQRRKLKKGGPSPSAENDNLEIRLADAQYQLAVAGKKHRRSEFLPRLYGHFNLYATRPDLLIEPDDEFALHYLVGAYLELPLFDGLRNIYKYRKAKHMEQIALIGRKEALRAAQMKRRAREHHRVEVGTSLQAQRNNVARTRKAYKVAKVAYRNELISYRDYLEAEEKSAIARVAYAKAQLEWLIEQVDME